MPEEIAVETTESPETVETPIVEQAVTTENAEPNVEVAETKPEKTFTQSELNEIITKRIERERESATKKASQEARDAMIAEEGYTWKGKAITTEAEYKQALKEKEMYDELQKKELPEEYIKEMIENRNFREQYSQKEKEGAAEAQRRADFEQFLQTFPDAKGEDIPQTVWDDVAKGTRLVDAYTRHENQLLKQKLAEVEQAKQIEQQNQENAASSTGSITGKAGDGPTSFTREQVEKMSETEVSKNYTAIVASMKKW